MASDQAGDPHRRVLDLRRDRADGTARSRPPQDRVECLTVNHLGDAVERLERHRGIGQRPGNRLAERMIREPVADGILAFGLLQRRQHAERSRGEARGLDPVDGRELKIAQARGAERARRQLGLRQTLAEQRRAALDGRHRVVQLVGQAGGQFAEGDHLLVVQAARREDPGAIEHRVHEDRRDLMTRAGQRGQLITRDGENVRGLLRNGVARRIPHARVGQHTRDVSGPPFHHLVPPRAAVDKDGDVPRQHDVQALHRSARRDHQVPVIQMPQAAVCGQPRELLPGCRAEGLVCGEPIDEICPCHARTP